MQVTDPMPGPETATLAPTSSLALRFTGSGSEYFRIWIVNLLLTVVTLGIYYPYAKARKLRYFHENTLVGGAPLSFHGDPRRMLRGYLLIGGLFVLYSILAGTAPLLAAMMLVCSVPLAPLLLWSALRFRLGQTGWRGLRFQFDGSLRDAYFVFLPIVLPLAAFVLAQSLLVAPGEEATALLALKTILSALGSLGLAVMAPWTHWRLKRYQHSHYRLGHEVTRLDVSFGDYFNTQFKVGLAGLLCALGIGGIVAALTLVAGPAPVLLALLVPLSYLVIMAVAGGVMISGMQNLIWGRTASAHARFHSDLALLPLIKALLQNALLVVCTLGFYWPFAAITVMRLRLEAIRIELSLPLDQITGSAVSAGTHTAGEAAADLNPLGFDIDL
ncbi:MAG: hypothetical protein RJA44_2411 [Pseudomonadota bacterium]|jgi:uncharacterized membrane protein YjgN (DUF898 family)